MVPRQRYSRVGDRRIFFEILESSQTLAIIAIRPHGSRLPKGIIIPPAKHRRHVQIMSETVGTNRKKELQLIF